MYLLTLSDINQSIHASQLQEPPLVPSYFQEHLQLLIKQMLMGLPVQPILDSHPQYQQWVFQLKELSPTLFLPQRKLFVDIPLQAKLDLTKRRVTEENYSPSPSSSPSPSFKVIQVRANIGLVKETTKLFEWAIRHPVLTWQDRVKLWVAAEFFEIEPHKLQLIVLALHPTRPAQKVQFTWDSKQHQQVKNWLLTAIEQETKQTVVKVNGYRKSQPEEVETAINLDEINEVSI
jgi:hypothetical protein